ncbi:MAG: Signal recognition particle, subunit Ffh SRP54 (TC 3.A.5.1.1) [uncultured Campylobacterales bacterium]|uniref:signal-recognition-particle GTPase n=1 Tax=uncultured Campylobacterales bacterium TaxID=352960 RepID=A0A6S6S3X9_9BACT|nr:MAG: Signal recognition particle, subunit Ffh SRP54 (TC 3.A.5.1.1) [uncultured Campylobacterales bacterium]
MFDLISKSILTSINKIKTRDDSKALNKALQELKKSLLKADIHHKVVKELIATIELKMKTQVIGQANFLKAIKESLADILNIHKNQGFIYASKPPTKILLTGLQGSGKTTTSAKLANYLKEKSKKVLIVACDLQRLAAIEQLKQLSIENNLDIYYEDDNKNTIQIAKNAMKVAEEKLYDVVIFDTAGRLAIDDELMNELSDVKKAVSPDEIFYVADSLTGQDAIRTASTFKDKIGIDGVILTKYDGDSKGGIAFGISKIVDVPLRFIGTGEKIPDFEAFIPERIISRIMGEGDLATLAEKTSSVIDEKQAKKLSSKIKKGEFNFDDFLKQLEMVKKLGNLKSLIGMIPGLSGKIGDSLKNLDLDSKEITHIKAMISSMTPKERFEPSLLNNSRKQRIANGAGLNEIEVNRFFKQFKNASKMAKKFSKGNMKNLEQMMGQKPF